jgi:hypothetical protein
MKLNSQGKLAKFYMWLPPDDRRVLFLFIFAAVQVGLWLWAHREGALFALALIAFSAFIVWLAERKKKVELFGEARAVVRAKVEGVKGRYCPRIDWK